MKISPRIRPSTVAGNVSKTILPVLIVVIKITSKNNNILRRNIF
jgi:hypothetical protein